MKKAKAVLYALAVVLAYAAVFILGLGQTGIAAESFTVTAVGDLDTDIGTGWAKSFKVLKLAWKAAAGGGMSTQTIPAMKGNVVLGVTNPGATAPSDNYDLYVLDAEGVDIFGGALNNRHTTSSQQAAPKIGTDAYMRRPVYGTMTFSMSGNSNADADGELLLFLEE